MRSDAGPTTVATGSAIGVALRGPRAAIIALLVTAVAINGLVTSRADVAVRSLEQREFELARQARVLEGEAPELVSAGRGYLLTGEPRFLEDLAEDRDDARETLTRLRELAITPESQALVDRIDRQLEAVIAGVERRVLLAQQGRSDEARAEVLGAGTTQRELFASLDELVEQEEALLQMRLDQLERERLAGLALSVVLLVIAGTLAVRLLARGQRSLELAAAERARLLAGEQAARAAAEALAVERTAILAQTADGVIVADRDGRLTLVNEAARRMHGVAELDGTVGAYGESYGVCTPDGQPYPAENLPLTRAVVHGETVLDARWRIRRPDGSEVVAQGSAAPVRSDDGAQLGSVLVLRDVTAHHEIERQKDEFLSSASHDLKNPLASIKGIAQILQRRATRFGQVEQERLLTGLATIDGAATQMTAQIDQLLDVARSRMGRPLHLERQPTDLVELARRAATGQQQATERHRIRVETAAATLVGEWDPARLERAVGNLLSNAVKYSPDGGEIGVRLTAERDAEGVAWAVLVVRDPGMGIPADELASVFERFHRSKNVRGRIDGTGIGLADVHQTVEQHGGSVAVDSREGSGATFTVRLPLAAVDDARPAAGPDPAHVAGGA